MRRYLAICLGGLALAGAAPAVSQDVEAGRAVAGMCRTCHGLDGYARIPIAPHIGGEPAGYLKSQLIAFKTGARTHEMMSVVAAGLSEQQIADAAAWYASQVASASLPANAAAAGAPEACVSCHGADGVASFDGAPNLAGEGVIYLETQLKAFRDGRRTHEIMNAVAAEMTDPDIRTVAEWYSAIQFEIQSPN
jgi:cytochrome c553